MGWSAPRDWTKAEYRPGSTCVDTNKPFQVAASFPVDDQGVLQALSIVLTQEGSTCSLSTCVKDYKFGGHDGMPVLTKALEQGMTPIISYWSAGFLIGMDGLGSDGLGPCAEDAPDACGKSVKFYDFSISDMEPGQPACAKTCAAETDNCRPLGCCRDASQLCYEKDDTWASCRSSCKPGIDIDEPESLRTPWTCRIVGDRQKATPPVPTNPQPKRHRLRPVVPSQDSNESHCAAEGADCTELRCCSNSDHKCFEKDETFASCKATCIPGMNLSEPADSRVPWSCRELARRRRKDGVLRPIDTPWDDRYAEDDGNLFISKAAKRVLRIRHLLMPSGAGVGLLGAAALVLTVALVVFCFALTREAVVATMRVRPGPRGYVELGPQRAAIA